MAVTILDRFKRILAPFSHPVLVYDADPPTIEDGDTRPQQMGQNGGMLVEYPPGYAPSVAGTVAVTNANLDAALSTRALESGGNLEASKTNLDTLVTRTAPGQAVAGSSIPVVLPAAQLPNASTAAPSAGAAGVPVRVVTDVTPGKQLHVQTSVGVANAANKLLFGFYNNTGTTLLVSRTHLSNTQRTPITGVLCQMNVRVSDGAISGGTTVTTISNPALVAGHRDARNTIPSGLTFNTNGTLVGAITTIESVRWSTDEVQANGSGSLAEIVFAIGSGMDIFDFSDDPVVVPNGYSFGVQCDATATNGSTLVDFNILRA